MKCATTSLCDIFAAHPQMFVSDPKELDFFCYEEVFARGWSWYESVFAGAEGKLAVGEGSPNYTKLMLHPRAPERIAKHLPDAKLIYIVRHPLKRIESHWLHSIASGLDVAPLGEFLKRWPHMIDTSLYWKQISAYRRFYPDKHILVLFFEDLVKCPEQLLTRSYEFLGVNPALGGADPSRPSHVSAAARLDGPVIRFLQKIPVAHAVKRRAPKLAHNMMRRLRRPLPARPEWSAETRREVVKQLADDTAEFLRHYGKPADFWPMG